ncbi:type II secretion system protein GspL [Massilia sp. Se16.2.3]|uniref:type II secretion system protein GspL n=1 Tax=Massilia sp. Se16.2.3 TaxID=2709303 RepID=UPI001E38921A|nr:type II secretion system protein GspL [Massilia sp. Se16.2.3]
MTTLYIRHPARAEGEGALCRFAVVNDGGGIAQQGEGLLRNLTDVVAASRRVVLLLAGADVNLLSLSMPPLAGARLRAALPGLVEEHVPGRPGRLRARRRSRRGGRHPPGRGGAARLARAAGAYAAGPGARAVAVVPAQLCLPLQPGGVSATIGAGELLLRQGPYSGFGLALDANPAVALQTARALAGDAPLTLYVPHAQLGEYGVLLAEAGPGTVLEADDWAHWIAGANSAGFDLLPGLGAAGARQRDWRRWRVPIALALLGVVVNLAGINIEWLRLRGEANAVRQQMNQTFQSVYPNTPMVDPVAQMRQNIARAQAGSGQIGTDEFIYLAAALGDASRQLASPPGITSIEYKERALNVRVKPETVDPTALRQLQAALSARSLTLEAIAPANWRIRSTGATQ